MNDKPKPSNQVRQGDVLLVRMPDDYRIPKTAKLIGTENVVLALGESTGHAHRIKDTTTSLYEWKGDQLVEVKKQTQLVHEEHSAIDLKPGVYKRVMQREFVSEYEAPRWVVD
jgi:hypothetical protein